MKKKKCPQCKNLISIEAPTCLHCGRPNKFITKKYINKKWNKNNNSKDFYNDFFLKYIFLLLILLVTTLIIIFN